MRTKKLIFAAGLTMFFLAPPLFAEEAPASVKKLVTELEAWGKNGTLVAAVKQQNSKGTKLDAIKKIDEQWKGTVGVSPLMQALLDSEAANELKKLEKTKPYYTEVFAMDNQGANVAMTNKTSDYWQGDEAKFTESYKNGQGAVHIGPVKFDKSAQAYLVQVSVPVVDGTDVIGAITIGVNVDELEKAEK